MAATRGRLKVYLGATPGAGKTFAMLKEGRERKQRGEDVAIAYVETYGRARTEELLAGLELIPRQKIAYRGTVLEEMDLDAVLARHPKIALVDELAHTNALDLANEIQFIDISPEALRKRMKHGNIYKPDKVDKALANFFRPGNLAALREIALRLVAQSMATSRGVLAPAEDVLVAIAGSAGSEPLIRRAVRGARRLGGLCMVVTVGSAGRVNMERYQRLAAQLGCSFVSLGGPDIAKGIIEAAQLANVRHLFMGQSRRRGFLSRWGMTLAG